MLVNTSYGFEATLGANWGWGLRALNGLTIAIWILRFQVTIFFARILSLDPRWLLRSHMEVRYIAIYETRQRSDAPLFPPYLLSGRVPQILFQFPRHVQRNKHSSYSGLL